MAKNEIIKLVVALILMVSLAPVELMLGKVPITLQTFVIFTAAALFGTRIALISTGVYLLLGALGLPVFAGYESGWEHLLGPTSGFLFGFLLSAFFIARDVRRRVLTLSNVFFSFIKAHLILFVPGFLVYFWHVGEFQIMEILLELLPGLLVKSLAGAALTIWLCPRLNTSLP